MTTGGGSTGEQVRGSGKRQGTPSFPPPGVLRRRRFFVDHLVAYVAVNLLLMIAWLIAGLASGDWFFWPVLVPVGWGVLLDGHARCAYGPRSRTAPDRAPDR